MKRFFKDGDTVLFQGDSITDTHRDKETNIGLGEGYPPKVKAIYDSLFPGNTVNFVNRAVSGDRTINLVERYDKDMRRKERVDTVRLMPHLSLRDSNMRSSLCHRYL